jgi:hypothetical protein
MQTATRKTLTQFWPDYVRAHQHPLTRRLHFVGTTNLLLWLLLAALRRSPALMLYAVASSYALAWVGHFFVERNIPATFRHPLQAGLCDLIMYVKMWRGEMDAEVEKDTRR